MLWAVASGDVWPLAGAEPGIEGIVVAAVSLAVNSDSRFVNAGVVDPIFRIVDVDEGRDRDTPRDLAGNVPIFELAKIVNEDLFFAGRMEFNLPCFENFDGTLGEWFDVNEPLLLEKWFDDGVALVAVADRVSDSFFAAQEVAVFECLENLSASLSSGESFVVEAGIFIHFAVVANNSNHWKIVALANFEVVLVVGWCNFYNTRAIVHIGVFVGDNRNFTVSQR